MRCLCLTVFYFWASHTCEHKLNINWNDPRFFLAEAETCFPLWALWWSGPSCTWTWRQLEVREAGRHAEPRVSAAGRARRSAGPVAVLQGENLTLTSWLNSRTGHHLWPSCAPTPSTCFCVFLSSFCSLRDIQDVTRTGSAERTRVQLSFFIHRSLMRNKKKEKSTLKSLLFSVEGRINIYWSNFR